MTMQFNHAETARQGMAFRFAYSMWMASLIAETKAGRIYSVPKPTLNDFTKKLS